MTMTSISILLGDWEREANCIGTDPDLFFPERGASPDDAKAVCAGCVVQAECLDAALARREQHGVWGGQVAAAGVPFQLLSPSKQVSRLLEVASLSGVFDIIE